MYKEERPWGQFENLLDSNLCKVKKITVKPNQRLSYQYHNKRSEHWIVIQGTAAVTIDDVKDKYTTGQYIFIPILAKHRIQNIGSNDLVFIEVQCGDYFGEDDIVRISDDYGR